VKSEEAPKMNNGAIMEEMEDAPVKKKAKLSTDDEEWSGSDE
jgi:hypothetical protein